MRNLSLEAKENRLFARESSVEVSKIPGLSRSSSTEKYDKNENMFNKENFSVFQDGDMNIQHGNIGGKSEPVMINKIRYT